MVYGDGDQVNRGEWAFDQLPRPGETITLFDNRGLYSVRVRDLEHHPVPVGTRRQSEISIFIIADFGDRDELDQAE